MSFKWFIHFKCFLLKLTSGFRENPLTLAGEKGHVELVSLLLSRSVYFFPFPVLQYWTFPGKLISSLESLIGSTWSHQWSVLCQISQGIQKHQYIIIWLCSFTRMANVECHTKKGCTPFHLACKEGHLQISQQLYEKGADTEVKHRISLA